MKPAVASRGKGAEAGPPASPPAPSINDDATVVSIGIPDPGGRDPDVRADAEARQAVEAQAQDVQKAVLAVTEDKDVVVQIVDVDGKVVRQIPPEDYLNTLKTLQKTSESMFHVKV